MMATITFHDVEIEYIITRSKRASLAMTLTRDHKIMIKAPHFMPEFLIKQFIKKNENWIAKTIQKRKRTQENSLFPEFKTGSYISFFGTQYPLTILESTLAKIPHIYFLENSFQVILQPNVSEKQKDKEIKKLFKDWLLRNMKDKLHERVAYWATCMNVTYKTIRIKDVKGHWGSCSSKKNLNFNYRIALLSQKEIDYIIIHELSHLQQMNHSATFWKIVAEYMPNYKEVRAELKKKAIEID